MKLLAIKMVGLVGLIAVAAQGKEARLEPLRKETGRLISVNSPSGDLKKWKCVLNTRTVGVELNSKTQWLEVDIPQEAHFSGVSVKTAYEDGGAILVNYTMQNESLPFYFEFSLQQNLTKGKTVLTLRDGATEFTCSEE